jgi:hypothetical protein
MNANELAEIADSLVIEIPIREWVDNEPKNVITDIATMLRQQQNEIEDLKSANRFIQNFAEEQHQRAVALEMRELTDEEIAEEWSKFYPDVFHTHLIDFARAILRKAGEK